MHSITIFTFLIHIHNIVICYKLIINSWNWWLYLWDWLWTDIIYIFKCYCLWLNLLARLFDNNFVLLDVECKFSFPKFSERLNTCCLLSFRHEVKILCFLWPNSLVCIVDVAGYLDVEGKFCCRFLSLKSMTLVRFTRCCC